MKYGELYNDVDNPIVAERIQLDMEEKQAYREYRKADGAWSNARARVEMLQKKCKHEHAVIKDGWQGGGIYYCKCFCPECGRSGDRFIPQYHMQKHNEWYNTWGNTELLITLEKATKIGKKIGDSLFDSHRWWGEVSDYDAMVERSKEK
jgi:hypothetical protein